jgi:hypothetical protein
MKTVLMMALAAATLGAAAAQDTQTVEERTVIKRMLSEAEVLGAKGGFLGAAVKGSPYSGEEITEFTQVLADGTHIHTESQTKVYRDSQGRVRRETPEAVTIWDPVANASYFLNQKDQTYRQMPLAVEYFTTRVSKDGAVGVAMRVGNGASEAGGVMVSAAPPPPLPPPPGGGQVFFAQRLRRTGSSDTPPKSLGRQTIEGLAADGTQQVDTIETGAIGNDRPIQITAERWFSPDLQTVVLTKHNDPRTGEEVFRLTNVSRGEPPANLFSVPAGYQKIEDKGLR